MKSVLEQERVARGGVFWTSDYWEGVGGQGG